MLGLKFTLVTLKKCTKKTSSFRYCYTVKIINCPCMKAFQQPLYFETIMIIEIPENMIYTSVAWHCVRGRDKCCLC